MKFSHALILASSLAFFACGGDDDSPTSAKSGYDCTVSDGVKVAYPAGGETFTVGQTIEVVFGTTIDVDHYVDFRKNESDNGFQLSDESFELKNPADGKTCHTVKVTLSADHGVEPTTAGVVRVIPYGKQNKGANSGKFTVKK